MQVTRKLIERAFRHLLELIGTPSPDSSGYPFAAFFKRQKIIANSRNSF